MQPTNHNQKTVIIIGGPTGIGKSSLSLKLAQNLKCSIISADSRQVYQKLNIGTAKPTQEELKITKHYCIDIVPLTEIYSAGRFEKDVDAAIIEAHLSSDFAIICGGTGLYINAFLHGLDEFPDITDAAKLRVKELEVKKGINGLVGELQRVDPISAETLDIQNTRRIGRALEVYYSSDIPYSSWKAKKAAKKHQYKILSYWLNTDRQYLYDRINSRTLKMIEGGWIEEVKGLLEYRSERALDTVGYKEIFKYLDGQYDMETLISEIQKQTRRYAKRQITWFSNQFEGKCLSFDQSSLELISTIDMDVNRSR